MDFDRIKTDSTGSAVLLDGGPGGFVSYSLAQTPERTERTAFYFLSSRAFSSRQAMR